MRFYHELTDIIFDNKCECLFEPDILRQAIIKECKMLDIKLKHEYLINIHNTYPCVTLGRNHVYVHKLIAKEAYGDIPKGYVVHHVDSNKLNNMSNNLAIITPSEHSSIHQFENDYKDRRSEEGKWKGINASREATYRSDITVEKINELLQKGLSYDEIAKVLDCGINTVRRRMGYNY